MAWRPWPQADSMAPGGSAREALAVFRLARPCPAGRLPFLLLALGEPATSRRVRFMGRPAPGRGLDRAFRSPLSGWLAGQCDPDFAQQRVNAWLYLGGGTGVAADRPAAPHGASYPA